MTGTSDETTQALRWPRNGAVSREGWTYQKDVIPEPIKEAQMELAYALLGDSEFFADTGLEGFNSVAVGSIDVDVRHQRSPGTLPEHVRREIEPLTTGGAMTVPLLRG